VSEKNFIKLSNDLLTNKYTTVFHEGNFKFNAPHHFKVIGHHDGKLTNLAEIHFQEGSIKESGVNGIHNEDLIAMVICRLEHFQKSEYSCRDNAIAITHLEDALLRLRKRTMGREKRKVEGTHKI
jgi:hypothetical protein